MLDIMILAPFCNLAPRSGGVRTLKNLRGNEVPPNDAVEQHSCVSDRRSIPVQPVEAFGRPNSSPPAEFDQRKSNHERHRREHYSDRQLVEIAFRG